MNFGPESQKSAKCWEHNCKNAKNVFALTKFLLSFDEIWLNFWMLSGAKGAVPRVTGVIIWISVVPTSAGRAACPCAPSFRDSPMHSCCGLIASFPGPCASSGGRLPEALFMVFELDSKSEKVCKSGRSLQELSNEYLLFSFKNRLRHSRERASQSLSKLAERWKKVRINRHRDARGQ